MQPDIKSSLLCVARDCDLGGALLDAVVSSLLLVSVGALVGAGLVVTLESARDRTDG